VNGVLYAIGGDNDGTVAAYDAVADSWTTGATMPTARDGLAIAVVNGVLYAVGGVNDGWPTATVEAYDPAADR